jgi:hypothetical protein
MRWSGCRPTPSSNPTGRRWRSPSRSGAPASPRPSCNRPSAAISGRSGRSAPSRALPYRAARSPTGQSRGRHPSAALRRASAVLGDRRGLVAPGAVAAAAAAQPLDRSRLQAARRCLGGAAIQPRHPPARARPCRPGHHRARPRPAPARLEPGLHPALRSAALAGALRHRARRDRALQRGARRLWRRPAGRSDGGAAGKLHHRPRAGPAQALPFQEGHRDPLQPAARWRLVTTYTDITEAVAGAGGTRAHQRDAWSAASPSAPRRFCTSTPNCSAPRPRPTRPTPRRPASSPPPATTSCSR